MIPITGLAPFSFMGSHDVVRFRGGPAGCSRHKSIVLWYVIPVGYLRPLHIQMQKSKSCEYTRLHPPVGGVKKP